MREILFRGKSIDLDKWVYGFYAGENCKYPWSPSIKQANIIQEGSGLWFEVAPETVGQFTGLTDKNGVKIFEGDIVRLWGNGNNLKGVVEYSEAVWWARLKECRTYLLDLYDESVIIGNIHDNLELLEGDTYEE